MMLMLSQQCCGMLKKVSIAPSHPRRAETLPFPAKAAGDAHTAGVPVGYVENLCETRTQLGNGRVLARLVSGGCNEAFFSIPLEGMHEL